MIEILTADLTGPLDVTFPFLDAGLDSDVVAFAVRNTGAEDLTDLLLVLQAESLSQPGLYVSVGVPPQDELWGRIRLTGQDNSAAPAQQDVRTDWTPIGAYASLLVPSLLVDGVRLGELKMRPPSAAAAVTYRWRLSAITAEHSRPLPPALTVAGRGILTHVGCRGHSALWRGFEVTSSPTTPDDLVHVAGGVGIVRGDVRTALAAEITLDQVDGEGAALGVGLSYRAALSLGELGVTLTKGAGAISPAWPAVPAGEALIDHVLVRYRDGDPTEIEPADIAGSLTYGRLRVTAGDGLQAVAHAGQAIAGGTWRYWSSRQTLPLAAEATNRVWQLATGEPAVTQSAEAPETTALGPIWEIETDVAAVTGLADLRPYAAAPVVLHLVGALPGSPGEVDSLMVHQPLAIEQIVYRLSDNGGGSAGQTVLELAIGVDTVYTSQATDDQRPAWPFDAAGELVAGDGIHELVTLRRGDILTLSSAEHPTGGTPAWAEAYLICSTL